MVGYSFKSYQDIVFSPVFLMCKNNRSENNGYNIKKQENKRRFLSGKK